MQIPKAVVCVDSIVRTHATLVWNMLYNSHCYCFVATAYSTVGIRHERTLSADSRSSQPRLTYVLPCSAQKKLKTQKRYNNEWCRQRLQSYCQTGKSVIFKTDSHACENQLCPSTLWTYDTDL